ncbi:MAG TPA: hypothetical protein VNL98_00285 [Gemmatimonadales bacterium]|nr:hypothetical protein [Gemmatimonadales bacterium]
MPTSRTTREFADRAEALSAFVRAAGDAPRMLPVDDGAGCPLFHALAALQWTGETGLVRPDDRLLAVWFAGEAAAAVIERREDDKEMYRFLGPSIETFQRTPPDGTRVLDEAFIRGYQFTERWSALAHFFVTTHGKGALVSLLGSSDPEVEQVRRWLLELFQGPLPAGSDHLHGVWVNSSGAGFLFPPAAFADGTRRDWVYVEIGD